MKKENGGGETADTFKFSLSKSFIFSKRKALFSVKEIVLEYNILLAGIPIAWKWIILFFKNTVRFVGNNYFAFNYFYQRERDLNVSS